MRDTSDMMEDALSEDTMMDCGGDGGGIEELVDLATDVADSSPTIRDAAQRLLTLLGVDEDNDDLLSSSEDEGVELDELEDDDEEENTRLLHQLAASLAEELKHSQQKHPTNSMRIGRTTFDARNQVESMETIQDTSYLEHSCLQDEDFSETMEQYRDNVTYGQTKYPFANFSQNNQNTSCSFTKDVTRIESSGYPCLDQRLRMDELIETQEVRSTRDEDQVPASWGAGWDACATEALRYLMEDEGLPPHHPTVVAMKDHLDLQRGRAFAQYTT